MRPSPAQYFPTVPHPRAGQIDLVLSPEGRVGHEPGLDATYRRVVSGDTVLRIAPDAAAFVASGHRGRTWTRAAIDAQDGADGNIPEAQDRSAASRAQDLSVSAAQSCDQTAGSSVVRGYHVCPHAARFPLPRGGDGLAQPGRAVLASVQHLGRGFLRRCLGRGHESLRDAGNLQHGPGLAVHQPGIHPGAQGCRCRHLHGWQRPMDGQCLYRAAVALGEM